MTKRFSKGEKKIFFLERNHQGYNDIRFAPFCKAIFVHVCDRLSNRDEVKWVRLVFYGTEECRLKFTDRPPWFHPSEKKAHSLARLQRIEIPCRCYSYLHSDFRYKFFVSNSLGEIRGKSRISRMRKRRGKTTKNHRRETRVFDPDGLGNNSGIMSRFPGPKSLILLHSYFKFLGEGEKKKRK